MRIGLRKKKNFPDYPIISRGEYREIILARMAGGDLYAAEKLRKIRMIDRALDSLR